ncbi:MAG: hypothetical protein QMC90_00520 [Dehalococcoidales bacterium]|nr:hypothetical protein [Dehalococcoidales bacterium]
MSLHIKPLRSDGIICVEPRRYKGHQTKLSDGSEVKPGDKIIELHLNSAWFKKRRKMSQITSGWEALQCFTKDLSHLAEQMVNGMVEPSITAIHGSSLLHVGAKRLGFQVEELPNTLWKRLTQFYLAGLMQIHHLQGKKGFNPFSKPLELKGVWLSKAELLRKYGNPQPHPGARLTELKQLPSSE